jgi:hypothetical protein
MENSDSSYRLVWFQHLHKAAGSSIVNQAIANGEILFPNHKNGNPCSSDGSFLPIWNYDRETLTEFIDQCEVNGITFIATEWGSPNFGVLSEDSRVFLMTCLREPWRRLVSNYNYDYYFGHSRKRTLIEYFSENHRIGMDNHLVRIYSRMCDADESEFDDLSVSVSLSNLKLFNLVLVVERIGDLDVILFEVLGWENKHVDSYSTFGNMWALVGLLREFRLLTAMQYLLRMKRNLSSGDREYFERLSGLEIEFYKKVIEAGVSRPKRPSSSDGSVR